MLANFSNLITFSRGSNATVTDASGRLTYAPNNLLTNSQDFEAAAWTKINGGAGSAPVVTANAGVAPDGSTTADRLQTNAGGTAAADYSVLRQVSSTIAGMRSIWMRSNTGSNQTVYFGNPVNNLAAVITPTWQRFSVLGVTANSNFDIGSYPNAAAGTQSCDILIWGAQFEQVTYQITPSPYVSTSVANLLGFSEDFTNAAWTKTNTAVVVGAAQNPINNLWNAQKLMEDTTNTAHRVRSAIITLASGATTTVSAYMKAGERTWAFITDAGVTNSGAYVNLATGEFGTVNGGVTRSSIENVGNGWYRVSVSGVPAAATSQLQILIASANGTTTYTGDGNSGIYIYGAQLSNSGSLDPYVPTPGAAPSSTAYYGPRFDYDPVTLAPKGLLIEEQRTNLLTYSEQFDNAAWPKQNATVVPNQDPAVATLGSELVTNGDFSGGTTTGWTAASSATLSVVSGAMVVTNGATAFGYAYQAIATVPGKNYNVTFSVTGGTLSGNLYIGTTPGGFENYASPNRSVGTYTVYFTATAATTYLRVGAAANTSGGTVSFDNISAKELIGGLIVAPDGSTTADKLVEDATNTSHRMYQTAAAAFTNGTTVTNSVYLKAAERTWGYVRLELNDNTSLLAWFNLSTGALGTVQSGLTASITSAGNGWYRCSITGSVGTGASPAKNYFLVGCATGDGIQTYAGTAGSGIYVWGAQLEAGAFATSYIPTVASTVTRTADVAAITGSLFSQWYRQDEGAFVAKFTPMVITSDRGVLSANDGSGSNDVDIRASSSPSSVVATGGVSQAVLTVSGAAVGVSSRLALSYAANDFGLVRDGGTAAKDTTGAVPTVTQMQLGNLIGSTAYALNGYIRSIQYIPNRISDTQLQSLTAS